MRLFKPNIQTMREKKDVLGLIRALTDGDFLVRKKASEALSALITQGEPQDVRLVNPLIGAVKDTNAEVSNAAANALRNICDNRAVDPLMTALKDENPRVRSVAAEVLGKIGDKRAVDILITALGDGDLGVRNYAVGALGQIQDVRAVESVIAVLKHEYWGTRKIAAEALGHIGDQRAVEPLIAILINDPYPFHAVRESAAKALSKIGDARAVKPLILLLGDKDIFLREYAAIALDQMGWQPDRSESGAAYWIAKEKWDRCVEIGAPAVVPLIAALKDKYWRVRRGAIDALGKIGDVLAVEPLIAALCEDKDDYVRWDAAWALKKIGSPAIEPLIATLRDADEDVRGPAAWALGEIGDVRAVEPLIAALRDREGTVRRHAADALWRIGDVRAFDSLKIALQDEDEGVRNAATNALNAIGLGLQSSKGEFPVAKKNNSA